MTKKNKVILGLSAAALALTGAGVAYAQMGDTTTRAEVQTKSAEHFAMMDANKDGKLDTADRTARQATHFAALDTDKNGSISQAEFTNRAAPPEGAMRGERMGGRHGRHGGGHEGMRGMHGGMAGGMMMRMADTNSDQAISQAEFTAAALKRFDTADANKDGTLTRAERQAAHQAMRGAMKDRMNPGATPPPAQ